MTTIHSLILKNVGLYLVQHESSLLQDIFEKLYDPAGAHMSYEL
jgi:hypothetical protein